MKLSRRSFLAGLAAAGAAAATIPLRGAEAGASEDSWATLIELQKCDGCPERDTPACVTACRVQNAAKFPEPDPEKIKPYWPQNVYEDWTDKRHLTDRLTPYNWIFVQKLKVEHDGEVHDVSVPRRCMHCDNPPCVKLCPFGVNHKDKNGPVHIDPNFCMGGAKCRTVCPWDVPQRQSGLGVYTHLDPVPAGGGVMFKCDLCRDRLALGKKPACVEACPKKAVHIGSRKDIFALAEKLRQKYDGHIYGREENGGTSTLYVSAIPFEAIDRAIAQSAPKPGKKPQADPAKPRNMADKPRVMRMHRPENVLERHENKALAALMAPFAGIAGAFAATITKRERPPAPEADAEPGDAAPHEEDAPETAAAPHADIVPAEAAADDMPPCEGNSADGLPEPEADIPDDSSEQEPEQTVTEEDPGNEKR